MGPRPPPEIDTEFGELLRACDAVPGIERIRFTSPHPKDFRAPVVAAIAECPSVCEHVHLPAQSGSSRVLKAMRRTYDRERYLRLVDTLRDAVPDLALGTDLIVGFPGETDADFEETLSLVDEVRFDSAFTFIYSPRAGTEAASLPDPVPDDVKHERLEALVERRAAHRGRAERRARRTRRGGSRRGPEPHRPVARARAHATEHDGQLRRATPPGRPRRRPDRGRDLDDPARPRRVARRRLRRPDVAHSRHDS